MRLALQSKTTTSFKVVCFTSLNSPVCLLFLQMYSRNHKFVCALLKKMEMILNKTLQLFIQNANMMTLTSLWFCALKLQITKEHKNKQLNFFWRLPPQFFWATSHSWSDSSTFSLPVLCGRCGAEKYNHLEGRLLFFLWKWQSQSECWEFRARGGWSDASV